MFDLPEHLLMGVDDHDRGPAEGDDLVRYICWCAEGALCRELPPRSAEGVS